MITLSDPATLTLAALTAGLALAIALVALTGWRDWLRLQRERLAHGAAPQAADDAGDGDGDPRHRPVDAQRIELAALRDRVRRLEAIAAGVDL